MAPREDFLASFFVDDERFIATREDAPVDADIPVLEGRSDSLNLGFDGLFDGGKNHPALTAGEGAGEAFATHKTAQIIATFWRTNGRERLPCIWGALLEKEDVGVDRGGHKDAYACKVD